MKVFFRHIIKTLTRVFNSQLQSELMSLGKKPRVTKLL